MILVDSDSKRLGWGVARFVGPLQVGEWVGVWRYFLGSVDGCIEVFLGNKSR